MKNDFKEEEWDNVVAELFNEEFYQQEGKPTWNEDDEIMGDFYADADGDDQTEEGEVEKEQKRRRRGRRSKKKEEQERRETAKEERKEKGK